MDYTEENTNIVSIGTINEEVKNEKTEENIKPQKRVLYFDLLNMLACFSVIALHMNMCSWSFSATESYWWRSLIYECVFYFAVPIFFMLTGATLLNYRAKYSTKTFLKKRISKILIPFVFWTIIYIVIDIITNEIKLDSFKACFVYIFNCFFATQEQSIFWFFMALINVYLCLPVLSLLIKNRKILWYIAIIGTATTMIFPLIKGLLGVDISSELNFYLTGAGYLIYVVLGFLLSTADTTKRTRIAVYILGILCVVFRYTMTYILSMESNHIVTTYYSYNSIIAMLPAVAVFLFFKNMNISKLENNPITRKLIQTISSCSFGIYLVHMIVRGIYLYIFNLQSTSFIFRFVGIFVVYFVSLVIVYLIKKIPLVKKIAP